MAHALLQYFVFFHVIFYDLVAAYSLQQCHTLGVRKYINKLYIITYEISPTTTNLDKYNQPTSGELAVNPVVDESLQLTLC